MNFNAKTSKPIRFLLIALVYNGCFGVFNYWISSSIYLILRSKSLTKGDLDGLKIINPTEYAGLRISSAYSLIVKSIFYSCIAWGKKKPLLSTRAKTIKIKHLITE